MQPASPKALTFAAELGALDLSDPARAHLTDETKLDYAASFRALKELIGPDRALSEITRDDCCRVRAVLVNLPPNDRSPGRRSGARPGP